MTSNQIANAANQINDRAEQESERHNQSVEDETKRHNLVLEDLQQQSLRLQQDRDYWEAWYKQESTAIQKEYNDAYLQYLNSQGQQKLNIEAWLAGIEERKVSATEQYNYWMKLIQDEKNRLEALKVEEDKRNNKALEGLTADKNSNDLLLRNEANRLQALQLEYQNSYWNAGLLNQQQGLLITQQNNLNNYNLGLLQLQNDSLRLQLSSMQFQLETEKWNTETKLKQGQLGVDIFRTGLEGIKTMLGFQTFRNLDFGIPGGGK